MNPEVKEQWLEALRSGEYEQTTGHLHVVRANDGLDARPGYCCLGVLCDLAAKAGVVKEIGSQDADKRFSGFMPVDADEKNYPLYDTDLPENVQLWAGLDSSDGDLGRYVSVTANQEIKNLIDANDLIELDFNQIADLVEEHL